jgi:hypothetical protein
LLLQNLIYALKKSEQKQTKATKNSSAFVSFVSFCFNPPSALLRRAYGGQAILNSGVDARPPCRKFT